MGKVVILLVLGMVLVGMTPIAVSDGPWTEENGNDQNSGEQGHGPGDDENHYGEQAQNGEQPNQDESE
jgi:hypothetical protein